MKALVKDGFAVYDVDSAGLQSLAPDVILTQDKCGVCTVSLADVERAVCTWIGGGYAIRVAASAYAG
ncbi:MAG: hypothetical protein ACWGMY_01115, partial [Hyphomicrobiaceae bacterium]